MAKMRGIKIYEVNLETAVVGRLQVEAAKQSARLRRYVSWAELLRKIMRKEVPV